MIVSRSPSGTVRHRAEADRIVAPRTPAEPMTTGDHRAALRVRVSWPTPGVVLVSIGGEVDMAGLPRITEIIRQRLTAARLHAVVLDLCEVGFASSAVLELLMLGHNAAAGRDVRLLVVPGTGSVQRLLEVTGLGGLFELCDSAETALAAAKS